MQANLYKYLLIVVFVVTGCSHNPYFTKPDDPNLNSKMQSWQKSANSDKSYKSYLDLGWAYWTLQNDSKSAMIEWDKAIAKNGQRSEAYLAKGLAYYFRADMNNAQDNLIKTISADPDSPYSELAVGFLNELYWHTPDYPVKINKTYLPLLADSNSNLSGYARWMMTNTLAKIAKENNKLDDYIKFSNSLGKITKWSVYGPFGEFGYLDFDKTFPPEESSVQAKTYRSNGREISGTLLNQETDTAHFRYISKYGGIYYAMAFIELDKEQELFFQLNTSELCSLLIDDKKVITVDSRKHYPLPFHSAKVKLSEGTHRVMLKIGDVRPYINFNLYATKSDGTPVELNSSPENATDIKTSKVNNITLAKQFDRYWLSKSQKDAGLYNHFIAALYLLKQNNIQTMKTVMKKALEQNPKFSPLYVLRAFMTQMDPTVPKRISSDRAKSDMRLAVELDQTQALAKYEILTSELEQDDIESALNTLEELEKISPDYYLWQKSRMDIFSAKGWNRETEDSMKKALELNPRNLDLLHSSYSYYRSMSNFTKAFEFTQKIKAHSGESDLLSDWYESKGELDKAIQETEKDSLWAPAKSKFKIILSSLERKRGNYKQAVKLLENAAKGEINKHRNATKLSKALELSGDKDKSMKVLEEALQEEPGKFSIRSNIAFLQGNELLQKHAISGDKVIAAYKADDWKPDSGAIMILDEYITKIFADGSSLSRTHIITKVQTKQAQTRHGEIYLPNNAKIYQARVIKQDGRILVPESIDGKQTVTMPNLEIGDYIEYDYAQGHSADSRLIDGRLYSARFLFQSIQVPTYHSRFVVIHPTGKELHFQHFNYNLKKSESKTVGENIVTKYENKKLDALVPEPFMPVQDEVLPIVEIALPVKWTEIRDYIRQQLLKKRRPSQQLQDFINENVNKNDSELAKAEKLFYAIAKEIEGEGQDTNLRYSASYILERKEGNRLILLSTLLNMLKIENRFLLARPKNILEQPYTSGNFKIYDDALLEVSPKGDKTLYVDANYKESVFNNPSPMLSGAEALALGDGSELFIRLPIWTNIGNSKELHFSAKIAIDGSAECEGNEQISGYYSVGLRRRLKKIPKDQIPLFFEMILNKSFPGTTLKSINIENMEDSSKPLKLLYIFKVQRLARQVADNKLRIEGAFFRNRFSENYIKIPSRQYPQLVNRVNTGFNLATIEVPEGFTIETIPQSRSMESEFGAYHLKTESKGNQATFTRDYTIPIQRVGLDKYMEFYKFLIDLDNLEEEDVVLAPKLQL